MLWGVRIKKGRDIIDAEKEIKSMQRMQRERSTGNDEKGNDRHGRPRVEIKGRKGWNK